jgi:hypothetical protein
MKNRALSFLSYAFYTASGWCAYKTFNDLDSDALDVQSFGIKTGFAAATYWLAGKMLEINNRTILPALIMPEANEAVETIPPEHPEPPAQTESSPSLAG